MISKVISLVVAGLICAGVAYPSYQVNTDKNEREKQTIELKTAGSNKPDPWGLNVASSNKPDPWG